jgi:MYXO-CTERM domain-containing protein
VAADVAVTELAFISGESNPSGGPFGRYHVFVPPGTYTLQFTAPGYRPSTAPVTVRDGASVWLPIALAPVTPCGTDAGVDVSAGRALPPHRNDAGPDAGARRDAGTRANAKERSGQAGCGCTAAAVTPRGSWLPIVLGVILLSIRRRRR